MTKSWLTFLSTLSLVVGSVAKGRSGGGGGSSSTDDSWDVPGKVKAALAFQIIWSIVILCLFLAILLRLRFVPPGRHTRAPYILLAIISGAASIGYLLSAIVTRLSGADSNAPRSVLRDLDAVNSILWDIDYAFEPAVCLWLIHLRGRLSPPIEGKLSKPWVAHFWKRVVDWSLVAITFIIALTMTVIVTNAWVLYEGRRINPNQLIDSLIASYRLNFAAVAFSLLLSVDIIVSLISLRISQKRINFMDPITTRLLVVVVPFVIMGFIRTLVVTIYPETHLLTTPVLYDFNLAFTIVGGVFRVGIIGGLLSTMMIPNVLWTPAVTTSGLPLPIGEEAGYMAQQSQQSFPSQPQKA